jgi:hypothetical protein
MGEVFLRKRGCPMGTYRYRNKINVVYTNGVTEQINSSLLDTLIASKRVNRFERADGWVEVGIDVIRGMGGPGYVGGDRRLT